MVDKKKVTDIANVMLLEQKKHTDKWRQIRSELSEEEQAVFDEYYVTAVTPQMSEEDREQALYLRDWDTLDYDNTLVDMKNEFREFFPEGWEE